MRCAECEPDPLIAARFCECCGRELVLHQTQAEETSPVNGPLAETPQVSAHAGEADAGSGLYDWAPKPNPASELRCPNCGGPSLDRDRCQACQQASSIECTDPATPARNEATASPKSEPPSSSQDASESTTSANRETPQALSKATTPVKDNVAAAWAKAVETEAVKTHEARPKRAKNDTLHMEKVRRPADVTRRSSVPVAPQHRDHPLALAGVAVVVAAIGMGAYWLRIDKGSVIARMEQLVMSRTTHDEGCRCRGSRRSRRESGDPHNLNPGSQSGDERAAAPTPDIGKRAPGRSDPSRPGSQFRGDNIVEGSGPERATASDARPPRRAAVPAVANKPVRAQGSTRDVPAVPVLTSAPVIAPPSSMSSPPRQRQRPQHHQRRGRSSRPGTSMSRRESRNVRSRGYPTN